VPAATTTTAASRVVALVTSRSLARSVLVPVTRRNTPTTTET
jgi:hypothetical protein